MSTQIETASNGIHTAYDGSQNGRIVTEKPAQIEAIKVDHGPARIMKSFTADDHRRRLLNIQAAEQSIFGCMKKHLVSNYLPGHASYNLGEYPSLQPYNPDEYDEAELQRLADGGIQILQVMEDWNDLLRLHGATRFSSPNPDGMKRFINMAHQVGIKVLIYCSTGYMQQDDPDMNLDWTREPMNNGNHMSHWKLIRCSPASAGWRAYLLDKTVRILDDYEADGLFNDWGYIPIYNHEFPQAKDEILAWEETAEHDAAKEDLSALIYSEIKRRGRIYKYHADFNNRPLFKEKLYDYLWVGEGIGDLDKMRNEAKQHPPYVVPCFDCRYGDIKSEEHQYLHTIPYMQFPQLLGGRPFTGQRSVIPGVHYGQEENDELLFQWRSQWRFHQANPDGPYIYGPWEKSPARPNVRETHAKWLKVYSKMVEEGTYAYIEISDSKLFTHALPENAVASVFVNLETYLVLANYGTTEINIETTSNYVSASEDTPQVHRNWKLAPETFVVLRKVS